MKEQKGITLIALIITIIVMLILVAVVINFAMNDNGIISNAKIASEGTRVETDRESLQDYVLGKDVYDAVTGNVDLVELETKLGTANWTIVRKTNNELKVKGKESGETFTITSKGNIIIGESPYPIEFYINGDSSITKENFFGLGYDLYGHITLNDDKNATITIVYMGDEGIDVAQAEVTYRVGNDNKIFFTCDMGSGEAEYDFDYIELDDGTKLILYLDILVASHPIVSDGKNLTGTYESSKYDYHDSQNYTKTVTFKDNYKCDIIQEGFIIENANYVTIGNLIFIFTGDGYYIRCIAEYNGETLNSFVMPNDWRRFSF